MNEQDKSQEPEDAAEAVIPYIHMVLPIVGAVNIFLIAFIAVVMT